jgi:hypothetical protein
MPPPRSRAPSVGHERQRHRERRAPSLPIARGLDGPSVQLDELLHERKGRARARRAPRVVAGSPGGTGRRGGEVLGLDAERRVLTTISRLPSSCRRPDGDDPALRRELDRVRGRFASTCPIRAWSQRQSPRTGPSQVRARRPSPPRPAASTARRLDDRPRGDERDREAHSSPTRSGSCRAGPR